MRSTATNFSNLDGDLHIADYLVKYYVGIARKKMYQKLLKRSFE